MTDTLCSQTILSALVHYDMPAQIYIGYSGGVDSHVLLHLVASTVFKNQITAVYVDHGLQTVAKAWGWHCAATAESLGVKFKRLRVNATAKQGESPEEAARNARYAAFKSLMDTNDVLMIAQHQEDQLETVLLQLMRGSGLKGLSAMPESTLFGNGILLRPLLTIAKSAIDAYAQTHALSWVNDPSNLSEDYDRNFLRNSVLPLLKQRWSQCDKTVARSAKHCADAEHIIAQVAEQLFLPIFNAAEQTLCISQLKAYDSQQQALVIRHWFATLGLKMPALGFIERLQSEVLLARVDSAPILSNQTYCIRRYRDNLYCLPTATSALTKTVVWPFEQTSIKLSSHTRLTCVPSSAGIHHDQWRNANISVRPRTGGEKIRLPNRKGHHALKKLFQEADIPPWQRATVPLIYLNDELAAVGDLWVGADFYCEAEEACLRFVVCSERDEFG